MIDKYKQMLVNRWMIPSLILDLVIFLFGGMFFTNLFISGWFDANQSALLYILFFNGGFLCDLIMIFVCLGLEVAVLFILDKLKQHGLHSEWDYRVSMKLDKDVHPSEYTVKRYNNVVRSKIYYDAASDTCLVGTLIVLGLVILGVLPCTFGQWSTFLFTFIGLSVVFRFFMWINKFYLSYLPCVKSNEEEIL